MKILHEGTEYERIEFNKISEEWVIDVDFEGNLCIELFPVEDQNRALILNQDEVKQLITFLQRRILKQNK